MDQGIGEIIKRQSLRCIIYDSMLWKAMITHLLKGQDIVSTAYGSIRDQHKKDKKIVFLHSSKLEFFKMNIRNLILYLNSQSLCGYFDSLLFSILQRFPFSTWANKALQNFLASIALRHVCHVSVPFCPYPAVHSRNLG